MSESSRKQKHRSEMSESSRKQKDRSEMSESFRKPKEVSKTEEPQEESRISTLFDLIGDKLSEVYDIDSYIIKSPYITPSRRKYKAELCIYKVPERLRKVKEDAYSPRVVAIGPFHRDNGNLAPMSEHKLSYMLSFLEQYTDEENDAGARTCLKLCIQAIHQSDETIRHCYIDRIHCKDKNELAEMMLIDGCFMLELFLRNHLKSDYMLKKDYESDPILNSAWTMTALKHDLALLENQIPFFILGILYDILGPFVQERCKAPKSVTSLALTFFKPMSQKEIKEEASVTGCKHLLDLLHKFYFPLVPAAPVFSTNGNDIESNTNPKNKKNARPAKNKWGFNYCASQILESGIEFQKGSSTEESLLNITFNQPGADGIIYIPILIIHDTTSISLFRNLIAFEQCSLSRKQSVTSYAFLMRSLISSSRDSKLLEKLGIIEHISNGNEEYLANKFQSIVDGVDLLDDFYFREVCDSVNIYHKPWFNLKRLKIFFQKQSRILWADYLSSAWKVMSILAAVTILILTSFQTYYTIHPRN